MKNIKYYLLSIITVELVIIAGIVIAFVIGGLR
jgi:hypothetical protein